MIYSSLSTNWRFPHWFAIAHVLNSYTQCVYFLTLFCLLIFLFVFGPLLYMLALNVSDALNCSYCSTFMKFFSSHSSTLAWKIPWMEEPGRLQSMESLRVGHDWATSFSLFTFIHWRRKWQPTPVFLPGESQGWGSLVGCCLWGHTELDTTEAI